MRHLLCTVLLAGLAISVSAQRGQLSLGLNTGYYPSAPNGVLLLGGVVDYRWRIGPRWEAVGELSANRFWQLGAHLNEQTGSGVSFKDRPYIFLGGLGIGYRTRPEGLHIGVLAGGSSHLEADMRGEARQVVTPAMAVSVGHGIGQHMDVSVDTWGLSSEKGEFFALPMLKLTYKFGRKQRKELKH